MFSGYAQKSNLLKIQHELDSLRSIAPLEKIYLHLDKDSYLLGDTVWYKVYVREGTFLMPSPLSGVVYIELADNKGHLIQRSRQMLFGGSTYGDFFLDPASLKAGKFTLRAYTRWLQNFGPAYFYERSLTVSGDYRQEWTVDLAPITVVDTAGKKELSLRLKVHALDGKSFRIKPITLEIEEKGKRVFQDKVIVDSAGLVEQNFNLPQKQNVSDLNVVLREDSTVMAHFPLREGLAQTAYDVQFLPESGHWLTEAPCTMGIKIIDQNGLGVNAHGAILDQSGKKITTFILTHKGMGRITLPPLPAGSYQAQVSFPDGSQKTYPLPTPSANGMLLHYDAAVSQDAIHLQVISTKTLQQQYPSVMLIGESRGIMCYGAILNLTEAEAHATIPSAYFPEGIVHFSLYTLGGQPLAQRMLYNRKQKQALTIAVQPNKERYSTRDSVSLTVKVKDSLGKGVAGNFSVAVTDDSQYQREKWASNILNHYYLNSELTSWVEDPEYYFSSDSAVETALDNLLLTQGWVSYDQSWLKKRTTFRYDPEPAFSVSGTVKNAFGKALKEIPVVLLATGKTTFFTDTLTDEKGKFNFNRFPVFDTLGMVIQARNKRGKSFNVGIDLDPDTQPPSTPIAPTAVAHAWFVNLDSTLQRRILDQREYQKNLRVRNHQADPNTIMLEEVTINAKKVVKGSKNLNGLGEADQSLTEEELLADGSKSLLNILEQKIKGFHLGFYPRKQGKPEYMVNEKKARLIFDGVDLEFFYDKETAVADNDHMLFIKSYLEQYTGNDVKGIEIMYSPKYNSSYNSHFLTPQELMNASPVMGSDPVYIEITTRGGKGPFMRTTPGVVHFRPMPFSWPHEFYRPRYPHQVAENHLQDLRSTIHWQPLVITDEQGKATLSFFTSDRAGTYTIWLEGIDDAGNPGLAKQKLYIDQKQ
ncbi:TonB-dependent receptor plug domain-containing protein [Olivibacter ginsenosidimutans]|uniref:TonB-dependent receptor plug domain-containing protein n=2 Tax=Olivibacter ginsenosidimutans TaxID=1176537 RepID=A0ABP9B8F4_9SPHI